MLDHNQIHEVSLSKDGCTLKATYFVDEGLIHININGRLFHEIVGIIPPRMIVWWLLEDEIKSEMIAKL